MAYNVLSGEVTKYINSSAVTAAWLKQNVFIEKRTDDIGGKGPCDIRLDKLDGARACSSDGSTAYFYMVSQSIYPTNAWGDYVGCPGVKNTEKYGLNLYEMGEAAEWLQNKYYSTLGYLPQVPPKDIYNDLTGSDRLPHSLFIDLPLINANGLPAPDTDGEVLAPEVSSLNTFFSKECADFLINRHNSLFKF